jgi:ABC-2 type transport system permease protein
MTAAVARAGQTRRAGYGFASAARMEWLKLRSLRSPAWSALIIMAAVIGLGIAVLSYYPAHWANLSAANKASFDPTNDGFAGMAIAQLAVGVAGVLVMTGEYSSGSIRSTLAAVPNRRLLLAAKIVVFGAAALVAGEVTALTSFLVNQYVVLHAPAPHASLGQPGVLRAVVLIGGYLALIGLLGLGLGTIIRHTAGAITALVSVVLAVPFVLRAFPAGIAHTANEYLPMNIAENSLAAVKPVADSLSVWAGLGLLCGYVAVTLLVGGWLLARRDA